VSEVDAINNAHANGSSRAPHMRRWADENGAHWTYVPDKKFCKGALVSLAVSAAIRSAATPVFIGKGTIVRVRHCKSACSCGVIVLLCCGEVAIYTGISAFNRSIVK
jgi:hypothetical protein